VDHHPHVARIAVDLHLDEMIAPAHGAELRHDLGVSPLDGLQVRVVRDRNVLPLTQLGLDADRLGAEAQDVVGFAL
jgi:hypothetical protein